MRAVRGVATVAVLALTVGAGGVRGTTHWTLRQARVYVSTHELALVDRTQVDQPEFDVRISKRSVRHLVRVGRDFRFDGPAHDVLRNIEIHVRFALRPSGDSASTTAVRGPPPNRFHPRFPMRTTFYYEWFPEGWNQEGIYPFTVFHPSLGYYSSSDPVVVRKHIAAMLYGHIAVATYDWWGQASNQDKRFPLVLSLSRQTRLRWAVYYEAEGYGDPSVEQIHDDLTYLRTHYFSSPAYLRIGGRPVVFAYGDGGDTCAVAQRWHDADEGIGAYVVLSAFAARAHISLEPYPAANTGGVRVAGADVLGEGKDEIVTAPGPGAPSVVKVVRRDGSEALSFPTGDAGAVSVAARAGEIATAADATGVVRVFSVKDGIVTQHAAFPSGLTGASVAVAKNVIVVGAERGDPIVKEFTDDGTELKSFIGGARSPVSVAAGGQEIVTGSAGVVHVFSLSGQEIYPSFSPDPSYAGDLSVAVGDARHEGHDDVITADTSGRVKIFSLADPAPVQFASFDAFDTRSPTALSIAAADTNGNGTAEVVAGAPDGGGGEVRILYGFRDCPVQPDSWHAYGGQIYENTLPPYQFGISPGFDKIGKPEPGNTTHPRNIALWREEILRMNVSGAPWHMIYTFNEWGEGTAIESAEEWATPSGFGAYLDALHAFP